MSEDHEKHRFCAKSYGAELKTRILAYAHLLGLTTDHVVVHGLMKMPCAHFLDARWKKGMSGLESYSWCFPCFLNKQSWPELALS